MKKKSVSVPRMFEQITSQIVHYIHINKLEAGTKLPTERELSALLGVSRSSLREALRVLELLQFVYSRQGEGTFVSSPPPILLPYHILNKDLEHDYLENYFDLALLHAEKILTDTAGTPRVSELVASFPGCGNFWTEFNSLLLQLGETLDNPYYASVWRQFYEFLDSHQFFNKNMDSSIFAELIQALQSHEVKKIRSVISRIKARQLENP
ncbi:GntR family transcriptional regulator [Evansella sp. LMS18]|uniref:GntR family transcriptional regulator n=1 Tax=Evansella sp. LMS18 TaxID=2924033 RepID=UPI0020D01620|nr:GntR family transcriptional regulator [Evansella sp. LMS18]UTR11929.1 GntR family transcriptional regulator [Evansella sp. LMS18]